MNKLNKTILPNKNGQKSTSGITLIALVITIIVLLILAGVTIAMLTGSDSAPAKANEAKQANDIGAMKDEISIAVQNAQMKAYEDVYVDPTSTVKKGEASNKVGELVITELTTKYPSPITKNGVKITIDSTGLVTLETTDKTVYGQINAIGGSLTWDITPPTPVKPLEIGADVDYETSLNGVTLDAWKVFYVDGDYTYIILDDYLPNADVSSTIKTTYNIDTYSDTYGIYSQDRDELINAMTTKSNWDSLLTGTINGHAVSETRTTNVWAMGAPTLDLWVDSWNATYPSDTLYTRYVDTEDIDNSNFYATGYAIGDSANPTTTYIDLSSETGYNNTLYYPHKEMVDASYGYWLASPSADLYTSVMEVNYDGYVNGDYCNGENGIYAFRPVVCLPTSVVSQ